MEPIILTTETGRGKRLDAFLAERVEGVSRAAAAKLIESGAVLLNGKSPAKSCKLTGTETVELTLRRQGRAAVLQVSNEGAAIPPDRLARLFDRFYRLDEARSGGEGHYGLGLPIARAVAEKHGGGIGVQCEDGRVIFTVTLPAREKPS